MLVCEHRFLNFFSVFNELKIEDLGAFHLLCFFEKLIYKLTVSFCIEMITVLEVGVLLMSALLLIGTNTFVSGK